MSVNKVNSDGSLLRVAGGTLYADAPIGAIQSYGGETAPAGWMICDGSAVSRETYADLFAVIGTAFGSGDGSTTFNIPDMRESVPKGAGETGQTVGAHVKSGGLAVGEFLDDRVQEHQHQLTIVGSSSHIGQSTSDGTYANYKSGGATVVNELRAKDIPVGRTGDTTEVKSVGVNYIIKAVQVALPADLASGVEEYVDEHLAVETVTGTGTTGLGFTAKKSGNVVTVYLYCTADVSSGRSITFGTLPEEYRPPRNVKFLIHNNSGSLQSTDGMFVDISSYNGSLASYSYSAITTGQCGAISYIVD